MAIATGPAPLVPGAAGLTPLGGETPLVPGHLPLLPTLPGALPTTPGVQGPAPIVAKPPLTLNSTDSVTKNDGESYGPEHGTLSTPELPASESVFGKGQQESLRSFVSQLKFGTQLLTAPSGWAQIQTRATQLTQNPSQSFVLGFLPGPQSAQIVSAVGASLTLQTQTIIQSLPPQQLVKFNSLLTQLQGTAVGQAVAQSGPIALAMLAEASLDYLICACTQMNSLDGQKNKDLIGQFIQEAQAKDESDRTLMDQAMGATNEKLEATVIQKAAAQKMKFWNAIFAVAMIVVAVVMAVLSVFTCGGTSALAVLAVMAAVAAITMAVLTVVTELPAILDALGVDVTAYNNFLNGPAGKVIMIMKIICAIIAMADGVGELTAAGDAVQIASTAVTVTKASLGVINAAVSIGRTLMNHSQAQIDKNLAELDQDVTDLAASMAKIKAEMDQNQVQEKSLNTDLKDISDQMEEIMTKMFAAMETQSQESQLIGRFLSPGCG